MPPYCADTNVYISAANDPAFRKRFEAFVRAQGPLRVSSIVVAEVLIGIIDHSRHAEAVQAITAGGKSEPPEAEDWVRAGEVVARLGGDAITKSRSFWNDALIAAQCARLGMVLLTHNQADFRRLGRHLGVQFAAPFP